MAFEEQLLDKVKEIENIIYSYLPAEEGKQLTVIQAMNYGVKVGGKRLRPMLILETFRLFDGDEKLVHSFMAGMEFIHTYSLIHDDLPCMDDAELRRGKPSVHAKFGEAMGVLSGDSLLNFAFETILAAAEEENDLENKARFIKAVSVLAKKSGIYGMIGGQSVDVEEDGKPLDEDTIKFIYKLKTGALIEASMMIGAIMAGASDEDIKVIEKIAAKVGLAFQIQDDILDVTSSKEELGKPVLIDDKNNKTTYVSLYGIEKSKEKVVDLTNEALDMLKNFKHENAFLNELILSLTTRRK